MAQRNRVRLDARSLFEFWSRLGEGFVHPDDREHLRPGDFATELHPVPWAGPIETADVYLLYLNPGYSPHDLPYEQTRQDFVALLRDNLAGGAPYFYLLDRFADHPGHAWASRALGKDITQDDLRRICVLQIVPYHSKGGAVARRAARRRLPSSEAIRAFVQQAVLPAARRGEVGLIVARSALLWGVSAADESPNVVVYRRAECRGAFVTPKTRGGALLRRWLSNPDARARDCIESVGTLRDRQTADEDEAAQRQHLGVADRGDGSQRRRGPFRPARRCMDGEPVLDESG